MKIKVKEFLKIRFERASKTAEERKVKDKYFHVYKDGVRVTKEPLTTFTMAEDFVSNEYGKKRIRKLKLKKVRV